MAQIYQDSMAIVRELGKPSLFITVMANLNWKKIHDQLFDGQTASNRPDIDTRVFQQKKKAILKALCIGFEDYKSTVWTIEYQKRDLPHMHCLLYLSKDTDYTNRNLIERTVWAELLDEELDPTGF